MNYKLAKQLKDAKFPGMGKSCKCCEFMYPTLSELISACGEKFGRLLYVSAGWFTAGGGIPDYGDEWEYDLRGKTPEEAVANLWLALNKKSE